MQRRRSIFGFLFVFYFTALSFSQTKHKNSSPASGLGNRATSAASAISESACSKEDFEKLVGAGGLWKRWDLNPQSKEGFTHTQLAEPPFAFFVQDQESRKNPSYSPPMGYSAHGYSAPNRLPSPILYKFKNVLHEKGQENFNTILQHSIRCLSKEKSDFVDALEKALEQAVLSESEPNQWSDFLAKEYDTEKREWLATTGPDPKTAEKAQRFLDQVRSLKAIQSIEAGNETRTFLSTLAGYLANPNQEGALSHLESAITHGHSKSSKPGDPPQERELGHAHALAGHVGNIIGNPALTSHLRQTVMMGNRDRYFSDSTSAKETASTGDILKQAFSSDRVGEYLLGSLPKEIQGATSGVSLQSQEEAWSQFDHKLTSHFSKLGPEGLGLYRKGLIHALDRLDSRNPESGAPKPLEHSLARETLLRALHAIEKVTPNPASSPQESFDLFMQSTQSYLLGRSDPKNKEADTLVESALNRSNVLVPLSVASAMRYQDPLVLKLAASQDPSSDSLKGFLQTGHSSALFNLTEPKQAAELKRFLTTQLDSSGVAAKLSPADRARLQGLLLDSIQIGRDSKSTEAERKEWTKHYDLIRPKLLEVIESSDDNPSKVAAWALELLDSTGNHTVLSSNNWADPSKQSHYAPQAVVERFREEKRLSSRAGNSSSPEAAIRRLIPGVHGISSEARAAALLREANPSEEAELLALYRDVLTQNGKTQLSDSQRDALKKFAFSNLGPDVLAAQIDTVVPGFSALRSLGDWSGETLSADVLPLSSQYRKMQENEARILQSFRSAFRTHSEKADSNPLALAAIARLEQEPGLLSQIYSERPSENLNPELVQQVSDLIRPLLDSNPQLKRELVGLGREEWRVRRLAMGSNESLDPETLQSVLSHTDKAVEASARLANALGDAHSVSNKYRSHLRSAFTPGDSTDSALAESLSGKTTALLREEPKRIQARQELLNRFGQTHQLGWDDSINAFVFTEHTKISPELLRALEKSVPDLQFVWRDSRKPQVEEMGKLNDLNNRIVNGDQALTLSGISPKLSEWFPIEGSQKSVARWTFGSDGKMQLQIADRETVLKRLKDTVEKTQEFKDAHDKATLAFGSFSHGAKAILLNPFGLGFDPSQSSESKALQDSWNAFSSEREKLGQFGLMALTDGTNGRNQLNHFLELGQRSLQNEKQAIQRFVENAELTADLVFMAGTAPIGGLAGALAKAPKVAGWGGRALWAAQAIANSSKAARDVTLAYSAFSGAASAYGAVQGNQVREKIKGKFESGEEWRTYPKEPSPQDFNGDEKAYRKAWIAWNEEKRWDSNGNGKPDFLEDHLKDYAFQGSEAVRDFSRGAAGLYRNIFDMTLTGQVLPNTGSLAHLMIPSLLKKEAGLLLGAGKPGDFTAQHTQSEILKETLYEGGLMAPAMLLPGGAMRLMPSSLQATIKTPLGETTTRNLVGTAAFMAGNMGANAFNQAIHGNSPLEGLSLSQAGFDFYIGHKIAGSSSLRNALDDLRKARFNETPVTPSSGQLRIGNGSSASMPSELSSLVKKHGQSAIDTALESLIFTTNPGAVSPDLMRIAADRLAARATEAKAASSKALTDNPFKEKSWGEINQTVTQLEAKLSGRNGLALSPETYQAEAAKLAQARVAQEAKLPEARLSSLSGQARLAHGLEQVLSDNIGQAAPAGAPAELRSTLEAIQRLSRSQVSKGTNRWIEPLKQTARQGNIWGDLASLIVNPHAPSATPQQSADRAWKILGELSFQELPRSTAFTEQPYRQQLLSHYVRARANAHLTPEMQAQVSSRMGAPSEMSHEAYLTLINRVAAEFDVYVSTRKPPADFTVHDLFNEFIVTQGGKKPLGK